MDLAICQDPKQVIGPEQYFDIGDILRDNFISNLTDHQKYMRYKNHFVPDSSYWFPKSFQHGCNRSCKPNYLSSSFVYSKNDDAVFCLYCSLFCNRDTRSQLSSFVKQGYSEWHNILEKQQRHVGNEYHSTAMTEALGLLKNSRLLSTRSIIRQARAFKTDIKHIHKSLKLLPESFIYLEGKDLPLENIVKI